MKKVTEIGPGAWETAVPVYNDWMLAKLNTLVKRPEGPSDQISPTSLVVEPAEEARVAALPNGCFHLSWRPAADAVHIYVLAQPEYDHPSRQLVGMAVGQETAVQPLTGWARPYFVLEFAGGPADGHCLLIAERHLPVAGSLNFRDIGGYRAKDGRTVRWGQVYRSGSLAGLQNADLAYLQELGIRLVCDLRSPREIDRSPDRLLAGMRHVLRPLSSQETGREQARILRRYRRDVGALLLRVYTEVVVDQNATAIGDLLTRLADETNRPALLHCAAGKDRTGVTIALLLTILGVSEDTILADYSLSNLAHEEIRRVMRAEMRQALWVGVRPSHLYPVLLADPQTLRATFAHIRQTYGSVDAYLREAAGIQPETMAQLRALLLEGKEGD